MLVLCVVNDSIVTGKHAIFLTMLEKDVLCTVYWTVPNNVLVNYNLFPKSLFFSILNNSIKSLESLDQSLDPKWNLKTKNTAPSACLHTGI